jgi:dGTPase
MAAVKAASAPVIAFSPAMQAGIDAMRAFLFERVYRHERVMRVMRQAEGIVTDLFARYMAHGDDMPEAWAAGTRDLRPAERARIVADFVAGMTDRFAIGEHRRLFDATPELR